MPALLARVPQAFRLGSEGLCRPFPLSSFWPLAIHVTLKLQVTAKALTEES